MNFQHPAVISTAFILIIKKVSYAFRKNVLQLFSKSISNKKMVVIKSKVVNGLFEGCTDVKVYGVFIRLFLAADNRMLVKGSPKVISKLISVNVSNFCLAVRELKRMGLVRKYSRWEYMINPECKKIDDIRDEEQLMHMWKKDSIDGLRSA